MGSTAPAASDTAGGYHQSRNRLYAIGKTNDYSVRLDADKRGNGDRWAAVDWVFGDAQAGNFGRIRMYGDRVRAAHARRDPRLAGWREVLIRSSDGIRGYDFTGSWPIRVPDDTHGWHAHFSILRENVDIAAVYQNMISILSGESLESWHVRTQGGPAPTKGKTMFLVEWTTNNGTTYWITDGVQYRTIKSWDRWLWFKDTRNLPVVGVSGDQAAFEDIAGRSA